MTYYLNNPNVKKIALIDLTHQGIIIAQELNKLGFEVTGIDVYQTLNFEQIKNLEHEGIIINNGSSVDFDLIICPVHLDPKNEFLNIAKQKNIPIISHHVAVRDILFLNKCLKNSLVIEITGTKGKTSTSSLLANIISKKSTVLLHTSRGVELWKCGKSRLLNKGFSIAPGSILQVMNIATKIEEKIDVYIFEISLGFIGYGNIAILTTLDLDYLIAANTNYASNAKLSSLNNFVMDFSLITNKNIKNIKEQHVIYFCINKKNISNNQDYYINIDDFELSIIHNKCTFVCNLLPGYDVKSYFTAFAGACTTSFELGITNNEILEVIHTFNGIEGRMQEIFTDNITYLDNSNSGMNISSVENILDIYLKQGKKIIIVIGEEAKQVCEGLDPQEIQQFIITKRSFFEDIILVGPRMRDLSVINGLYYADNLKEGKKIAIQHAHSKKINDIIIALCVKCFR